jgi:hypothetical protein
VQITDLKKIAPLFSGAIAAGATILAVIVTSFFNLRVARLNIEAQSRQKAVELKLAKLEELFFLFDKWHVNFTNIYLHHLRCYKGKLEFTQVMELIKEQTLLTPGDAQKYRMIMDIHFPSLKVAYASIEEARKRLVPFLSDPKVSKLSVEEFINYQVAFEKACDVFKDHVSSLAHESFGISSNSEVERTCAKSRPIRSLPR